MSLFTARQQAQKAKADKEKEVIRLQKKASKEKKKTEAAAKQNTQNTKSSEIKTINNELQAASKVNQFNSRTNNERQQTASQGIRFVFFARGSQFKDANAIE